VLVGIVALALSALLLTQAPFIIAGAILRPARVVTTQAAPAACRQRQFEGAGVTLRGWSCDPAGATRGTLVSLHGVADNRRGAAGLVPRFARHGLAVVAYDSRAHGESDGEFCTYGFHEKQDLQRVIAALPPGPVILFGASLGGAVALQAAAGEPRVSAVVAAETFSDLATVVRERAPAIAPDFLVRQAFRVAGERGNFDVEVVSPVRAAPSIRVPVLLIHGEKDRDTGPDHSRRIYDALAGEKRLIVVPGAAHGQSLSGAIVWSEIEAWVDSVLRAAEARGTVSTPRESTSTAPASRTRRTRPLTTRGSSAPRTGSRAAGTRC
jgi:pimeloyl-ACP methyl ester carboxylesterase